MPTKPYISCDRILQLGLQYCAVHGSFIYKPVSLVFFLFKRFMPSSYRKRTTSIVKEPQWQLRLIRPTGTSSVLAEAHSLHSYSELYFLKNNKIEIQSIALNLRPAVHSTILPISFSWIEDDRVVVLHTNSFAVRSCSLLLIGAHSIQAEQNALMVPESDPSWAKLWKKLKESVGAP